MPFHGVLPERKHVFQPEPKSDIGVNDPHAWRLNPDHRHIYNKLDLAYAQNLVAGPCGVNPIDMGLSPETALFIKPITNLSGMSLGAYKTTVSDLAVGEKCHPGSFWCQFIEGEQTSTDCLLLDGKVKWMAHTRAARERNAQRPLYWHVGVDLSEKEDGICKFVETHLSGYTGICNLEQIGTSIIEMHMRGSNAFFDMYGADFIQTWIRLVDEKKFHAPGNLRGGYLYSVFHDTPLQSDLAKIATDYKVTILPDHFNTNRRAIIISDTLAAATQAAFAMTN